MAGEGQLRIGREDPHAMVGRRRRRRRQHEGRLRKVEFLRDRLHRRGVQLPRLAEHRQRIASERLVGEDVDDPVVVAGHLRATADRTSSKKASKTGSLSFGPGAPSGWYW